MSSSITLPLIILAVLAVSLAFLIQAEGGTSAIPKLIERVGLPVPSFLQTQTNTKPAPSASSSSVPTQFQSGNSAFSKGSCATAADCVPAGCSGQVCTNKDSAGDLITTCEWSPDFPNEQGYSCTCLPTKVCGWE